MLYSDPSGHLWETLFDVGSLAWSTWDLITNPSWENAGWFALDLLGLAIPFIPSPGALKVVKWLNRGENLVDGLRTTKTVTRVANWAGDVARTTKTAIKSGLKTGADVIRSSKVGSNVLSSVDSIMASINDSLAAMKRTSEALGQKNKKALVQRITTTPNTNEKSFKYFQDLVEKLDVSTKPNTATFYSGIGNRELAEHFALQNGKTTLEMTRGGKYLDNLNLFENGSPLTGDQASQIWARLSERYAQNASGNVYGFVSGARTNSIFNTVEYPALKLNPNVTNIFTEIFK